MNDPWTWAMRGIDAGERNGLGRMGKREKTGTNVLE